MEKLKVYCPYSVLDLEWETLKNLQNITFEKPWYLEYNTDTSAQHPEMDDDIVRPILKNIEPEDKEPLG